MARRRPEARPQTPRDAAPHASGPPTGESPGPPPAPAGNRSAATVAPTLLAGVPPPPNDLTVEARRVADGPAQVRGRSAGRIRRSGKLSRGLGLVAAAGALFVLVGWVVH